MGLPCGHKLHTTSQNSGHIWLSEIYQHWFFESHMSLLAPSQPPLDLSLRMPLPVRTRGRPANTTSTRQLPSEFEQVEAANRAVFTPNQQLADAGEHEVEHEVGHEVGHEVRDVVEDEVENKVDDEIEGKVEDKVRHDKHEAERGNTDVQEHDISSSFPLYERVTQGVARRRQAQLRGDI